MVYANLACVLISVGMLMWLLIYDVRNSVTQFITIIIMLLSNYGHYMLSISSDLMEAILAQKIAYIGGMFLPLFYFILMFEICHIKLPRTIFTVLIFLQFVGYGVVCTIGNKPLYYKQVGIYVKDGVTILDRVYGPLHMICPLSMAIYLFASLIVALYSFFRNKSVNRNGVIAMVVFATLAAAVYVGEKTVHLEYEIIPIAFVLLMVGTLIPVYDSNVFTAYENTEIISEQLEQIGFLTFDKKLGYKGCNDYIAGIFPELSSLRVGQKIEVCSERLQEVIRQIIPFEELYQTNVHRKHAHVPLEAFMLHERYYTGVIHAVTNAFGKLKGYTIEIRDETEHYQALQLREHYNEELASEVTEKTKRIRFIQQKTILGMAQMVESRDLSTGGHIKRTSDVVRIFSSKLEDADMGLDHHFLELVIRSAPMHDIGKIGVDDAILRKQGRFTDEEYEKMKMHSKIGYHMVSEILSEVEESDFVRVAENVAHYHHEKVDGTGYPEGLKGEEIPVEARIMALADVFDALVSKRCYKEAFSFERAYEIIEKDAGTHFDQQLAMVFLSCKKDLENYYKANEA